MRSILAFILTLAASCLVTWAGFHYADTLGFIGVALIVLVLILFGHSWAFPKAVPVQYVAAPPEPEPKDEKERVLRALRYAREHGVIALKSRKEAQAHTSFNEIQAVMLSVQKQFGIGQLTFTGLPSYRAAVNVYLHYIDEIYPRLKEGHVEQAKAKAKAFKWGD